MSEIANDGFRGNAATRCVAHRKNGDRCKRQAIKGATVCRAHGGAAGHVKRKARQRIEESADRMARALLNIAESGESEAIKLRAIESALDRAGLKPPSQAEITVAAAGPRPYETLVAGLTGETRAESRAKRGMAELPAAQYWDRNVAEVADGEVIDVETVPDTATVPPHFAAGDFSRANRGTGPDEPAQPASSQTPGTELMTMEEANELLAQQRGQANRRHP